MRMSYELTLEQTQKLIMTPELRQAIELLQLNSLELKDYIAKELEENPLIEVDNSTSNEFEDLEKFKESDIDWREYFEKYDDISYRPQTDKNIKEYNYESFVSYEPGLRDHLRSQLNLMSLERKDHQIGLNIIGNIDSAGYLRVTTEDIGRQLKVLQGDVEIILKIIQSFDPLGVGARDLRECLLIQVDGDKDLNPKIKAIIEDHLEDLGQNRMQKIAKELDLEIPELQDLCDHIRSLDPKPGRAFPGNEEIEYILPDAEIVYDDGNFYIVMNEAAGPKLNISLYYRNLLKGAKDEETIDFLNSRLNSAMWLIRSIEQRKNTIKKVIESIVKFQEHFFAVGEKGLVPLTLKDVAEDIDMHESTVSRATNGKYVQTPRGLFELKYFFSSSIEGARGDISSTSIKSMLKDIIDEENPKKPYSDSKLVSILEGQGINISRRTIAKYRDELNIPSSTLRRRY